MHLTRQSAKMLRVGDPVRWRGAWGSEPEKIARVKNMEVTDHPREKYGMDAEEVSWDVVFENRVVVSLDNGHWAYGEQLRPL